MEMVESPRFAAAGSFGAPATWQGGDSQLAAGPSFGGALAGLPPSTNFGAFTGDESPSKRQRLAGGSFQQSA